MGSHVPRTNECHGHTSRNHIHGYACSWDVRESAEMNDESPHPRISMDRFHPRFYRGGSHARQLGGLSSNLISVLEFASSDSRFVVLIFSNKPAVPRLATGITLCSMDTDTPAPAKLMHNQYPTGVSIWGQPKNHPLSSRDVGQDVLDRGF